MRTHKGTPGGDDPGPELQWLEDLGTRVLGGALDLLARLAALPVVVAGWVAALVRGGGGTGGDGAGR